MIDYRQIQEIENQICIFTITREDEKSCGEIVVEILNKLPLSYRSRGVIGEWGEDMATPQSTGKIGLKGLRWFASELENYLKNVWNTNFGLYCQPVDVRRADVFFRGLSKLGFERFDDDDGETLITLNPIF